MDVFPALTKPLKLYANAVYVGTLKQCLMRSTVELDTFMPVSVTLTHFQAFYLAALKLF